MRLEGPQFTQPETDGTGAVYLYCLGKLNRDVLTELLTRLGFSVTEIARAEPAPGRDVALIHVVKRRPEPRSCGTPHRISRRIVILGERCGAPCLANPREFICLTHHASLKTLLTSLEGGYTGGPGVVQPERCLWRRIGLLDGLARKVLGLVLEGHSHGQIARLLHCAPGTVRNAARRCYAALGVRGRLEAVTLLARPEKW